MRRRISWLVLATTSTVVASFVIPLRLLVQTLAQDRAMAAADQEARNVAILVASVPRIGQLRELVTGLDQRGTAHTSVLTPDGTVIGDDPGMAGDPEVRRAQAGTAFSVTGDEGGRVLLPVVVADGTAVVRSAVTEADLRRGVLPAWLGIVGLGIVLLAASWVIAARLGRRISEPLREVAGVAHRLREGDLTARAEVSGTEETQELARALNGLAERTVELLAAERAAVADLSHRLRTPVTALRLDAEGVADPEVAGRLQEHIAALQRTVDVIVKEARRPVRTDLSAACEAAAVVRARVGYWSALAEDQQRPLEVDVAPGPLVVPLARVDLTDLVDVLVDNVFAHTPERTPFRVALTAHDRVAELVVADRGPGFAAAPAGRPGTTGLGLDIVRRAAAAAGGTVAVDTGAEGTRVSVRLPLLEARDAGEPTGPR